MALRSAGQAYKLTGNGRSNWRENAPAEQKDKHGLKFVLITVSTIAVAVKLHAAAIVKCEAHRCL